MATALDTARWLIGLGLSHEEPEDSDFLCPMRVQKLLYYVQGWSLALRGRPMFEECIEAWKFGPVVPEVYRKFKPFGCAVITPEAAGAPEALAPIDKAFIESVWSEYKAFSATKLREMTHAEAPWRDARRGLPPDARSSAVITLEGLRSFFEEQAARRQGIFSEVDAQERWGSYEEMLHGGGHRLEDVVAGMKK